jgi:hypothetical protein
MGRVQRQEVGAAGGGADKRPDSLRPQVIGNGIHNNPNSFERKSRILGRFCIDPTSCESNNGFVGAR